MSRRKSIVVDSAFGLTNTEMDVLRALCEGRTAEGVGLLMDLSPHTVRDYIKSIFKKMGVCSQVAMAIKAQRAGLLDGVHV